MKAKVLIAAVAGLAGLAASADVLYWQVNPAESVSYDYAILRAVDGNPGGYKPDGNVGYFVSENINAAGNNVGAAVGAATFTSSGTYVGGVMDAAKILSVADGASTYGGNLSSLYFFIELFDGATGQAIYQSAATAYDTLVANGTVSGFNANFTGVNAALGSGSYAAVPEPTSGLLMLIGVGALALRRRRIA